MTLVSTAVMPALTTLPPAGIFNDHMLVRIRIAELLKQHEMTPYALSAASGGRISMSTAYRLKKRNGRLESFEAELLEALCEIFQPATLDEILERDRSGGKSSEKAKRESKRARKPA